MDRSQSAATDKAPLARKAEGFPTEHEASATSATVLRFNAPDHVSAVILSTGREIRIEGGMFTAPDDLSDDERRQIGRAGCTPA